MDVERIIDDIEQLQEMFEAPDIRPLSPSDISAANRRHDECLRIALGSGLAAVRGLLPFLTLTRSDRRSRSKPVRIAKPATATASITQSDIPFAALSKAEHGFYDAV